MADTRILELAGVDGCAGGWAIARLRTRADALCLVSWHLTCVTTFDDVLASLTDAAWIAVDMPIGLEVHPRAGGRDCDRAARARLGPRRNSVFSPPARPALAGRSFDEARALNHGRLNYQSYNLLARLREVDAAMTPGRQRRVYEAHPELAFARLAGRPLAHPKRDAAGRGERAALLEPIFGTLDNAIAAVRRRHGARSMNVDDALDACVLVHTAFRIATGQAVHLPQAAIPRDARGLEMAIWY